MAEKRKLDAGTLLWFLRIPSQSLEILRNWRRKQNRMRKFCSDYSAADRHGARVQLIAEKAG
jgi:hypothetical protein